MSDDYYDPEGEEPGCIDWEGYDIRDAGRAAARAGGKMEDNPYQPGTDDHWNWEFGFNTIERNREIWRRRGLEPPD